jgi:hypothetical protein
MKRRAWLKLGLASAAVLAVGGGLIAWVEPGWRDGRLSMSARGLMAAVARGFLDGNLPTEPAARTSALSALLGRVDILIAALPAHAQDDLSQLLALLATPPGRTGLAGLAPEWAEATVAEVQLALQSMRTSRISLRQQAYHALHDITLGTYFSEASTWDVLGYPGPLAV